MNATIKAHRSPSSELKKKIERRVKRNFGELGMSWTYYYLFRHVSMYLFCEIISLLGKLHLHFQLILTLTK